MKQSIFRKRKKKPILIIGAACLLVIVLVVVLLAQGLSGSNKKDASGSTPNGSATGASTPSTAPTTAPTRRPLPTEFINNNTFSPRIMLYDATAGKVLYQKNPDEPCAPASLTKLMTALVAVENTPADTVFTVGNEVYMCQAGSSLAYLAVGNKLTLAQLLQAMLLPSGNDAAYVTAVQVGRLIASDKDLSNSEALQVFVDKMNEKAKQLDCTKTTFKNPDGFDKEGHETTATDMMKICVAALNSPLIAETVAMPVCKTTLLSGQWKEWKNSNQLLAGGSYALDGAMGMKTGTTDAAGCCLAACATRDGRMVIALVLGTETNSQRYEDARGLLELAFQ